MEMSRRQLEAPVWTRRSVRAGRDLWYLWKNLMPAEQEQMRQFREQIREHMQAQNQASKVGCPLPPGPMLYGNPLALPTQGPSPASPPSICRGLSARVRPHAHLAKTAWKPQVSGSFYSGLPLAASLFSLVFVHFLGLLDFFRDGRIPAFEIFPIIQPPKI